jgi:hypothetical protein
MATHAQEEEATTSLFGPRVRTRRHELAPTATAYERLAVVDAPLEEDVRQLLQAWWERLPDAARPQIRERFADPDSVHHLGAFWEMYLHEAALREMTLLGVDIGNDDDRRIPDFLIAANGSPFWMEATVAGGDDFVGRDERARVDQLYAAIARRPHPDFLIGISLRAAGPKTPGAKLVRRVDAWLSTLDWEAEIARKAAGADVPRATVEYEGWELEVEALARIPERRGDPDAGAIGWRHEGWETHEIEGNDRTVRFEGPKRFRDIEMLTKALTSKAGHGYELGGRPLVLAVLCAGALVNENDIAQALFGRLAYSVPAAGTDTTGHFLGGGLWMDRGGKPTNTRVSAVLTVTELTPYSCASAEPVLWLNPAAANPIPRDVLPWRAWEIDERGAFVEHDARRTPAEVLGLGPRQRASEPTAPGGGAA